MGAPVRNYPISIDNGNWAYHLTNVQLGSSFLGYNGVITVNTESSWSLVPLPLLQLIAGALTGNYSVSTEPPTYSLQFNCTSYLNSGAVLPNIVFYLDGQPFVLTPRQYLLPIDSANCMLMIVAPLPGMTAYPSPYTIGTFGLNSTYSVFNMTSRVMSIAPLLS